MLQLTHKHIEIIQQLPSTANVQVNSNSIFIEFPQHTIRQTGEFSQPYFLNWLEMNGYDARTSNNIVTIILYFPEQDEQQRTGTYVY